MSALSLQDPTNTVGTSESSVVFSDMSFTAVLPPSSSTSYESIEKIPSPRPFEEIASPLAFVVKQLVNTRRNGVPFTFTVDLRQDELLDTTRQLEKVHLPAPMSYDDLLEAARCFLPMHGCPSRPLMLTAPQLQLRDELLKHIYKVLYGETINCGTGRLVLGPKGVGKTTVLHVVYHLVRELLPSALVFFATVGKGVALFPLLQRAAARVLPPNVTPWLSVNSVIEWLPGDNKLVGLVDEYHGVYRDEENGKAWIDSMHALGQSTQSSTFVLGGSSPRLRSLAFGKAVVKDVKDDYPLYKRQPNLNHTRYTAVELLSATTAEEYRDLLDVFGLREAHKLLDVSHERWLSLVAMATGGVMRSMEAVASEVVSLLVLFLGRALASMDERSEAYVALAEVLRRFARERDLPVAKRIGMACEVKEKFKLDVTVDEAEIESVAGDPYNTTKFHQCHATLLNALGGMLEKQAEARGLSLFGKPFELMQAVAASSLEAMFSMGELYQASDDGAIRYNGSGTVAFGSPVLAQYVLDKTQDGPKWFTPQLKAYLRAPYGKHGIRAEAAVRWSIAARLNDTDLGTRSGDTDGKHTLRHEPHLATGQWSLMAGNVSLSWDMLTKFGHVVDEDPDLRGCDAVWFEVKDKILTVHRYQIKLGERVLESTAAMFSLLVGNTTRQKAIPFDENARKALESALQGQNPGVEVKIKTYLVTTLREKPKSSWRTKATEHDTDHLTCEFWGRKECSDNLWHPAIKEWAKKEGLTSYYV